MSMEIESLKKLRGATGKSRCKSKSKQIGVKSTIVTSKGVAISSYAEIKNVQGKKVANIEILSSVDGSVTHRKNLKVFKSAEIDTETVKLGNEIGNVKFDNPAKSIAKGDYVGIKGALEEKYFGITFPNDSIHVQIAYNIADIKKYITQFINQIVYAFFNINRMLKPNENVDPIGMLYWNGCLKNNNNKDSQSILDGVMYYDAYFPKIFRIPKKNATEAEKEKARNYNWDILRCLSAIRQVCEHETLSKIGNTDKILYDLENTPIGQENIEGILNVLDKLYQFVVDNVNKEFSISVYTKSAPQQTSYDKSIQNKKKAQGKQQKDKQINNLYILSQIYKEHSCEKLFEKYYCYVVKKDQNSIGINLKLLREIIIEKYMRELRDTSYDSFRSKLYTVLGFILAEHLRDNPIVQETVVKLRSNSGEEGRLLIYDELADKTWKSIGKTLLLGKAAVDKESLNHFKGKLSFSIDVNSQLYAIKNNEASYFTKHINLMTKFLDGKEINELLTGLITRFDNIADLTDSASECGEKIGYKPEYSLFCDARKIAQELKLLKNVAKMKAELDSVKNSVLFDAAEILGWNDKLFDEANVTDDEKNNSNSAFLNRIYDRDSEKPNKRLRNFIINNVVDSKWFFYIARYTKPAVCRKLMTNKKLISFVLNGIPDEQINKYYKSVEGVSDDDVQKSRELLTQRLYNFSINKVLDKIEKLDKFTYAKETDGSEKQKNQAIVGLYLTVVYLFVKNMVKINSVFSIAFSCLERDSGLMGVKIKSPASLYAITDRFISEDKKLVEQYNNLRDSIRDNNSLSKEAKKQEYKKLKMILNKMHYSLEAYYYINALLENAKEIEKYDKGIFDNFRNIVAHVNGVVDILSYVDDIKNITSYYSVYAYCVERSVLNRHKKSPNYQCNYIEEQKQIIEANGNYSGEMLELLNIAFAYNMARYKNLSDEDLFYGRYVRKPFTNPARITSKQISSNNSNASNNTSNNNKNTVTPVSVNQANASAYDISLIGTIQKMIIDTVTSNKKLRGKINGTSHRCTISLKAMKDAGIYANNSQIGKTYTVEITGWDTQSSLYIVKVIK